MRPGIDWVGSGWAPNCFLAEVWHSFWELRLVKSVLVLEYHLYLCIVSASIFFLDCPYRVVHPGFWFCSPPVGGWSAYSKSTNSCSCSSPCRCTFALLRFFKRKWRSSGFNVLSVCETFYSLLVILGHGAGSIKSLTTSMKNTFCLFQIKFITEYTNVQHVIITQILLKLFN